jgi:hypothetical protein
LLNLIVQLSRYFRIRKKYWLAPLLTVMLVLGGLLLFAQGSAIAPFVYTFF